MLEGYNGKIIINWGVNIFFETLRNFVVSPLASCVTKIQGRLVRCLSLALLEKQNES